MHRISQRIKNCRIPLRNRCIQLDNIRSRNFHKFRERAILIDSDNFHIGTNVRFAYPALVAMPAIHMHFRADKIPGLHDVHFAANTFHHSAKFMP